MQKGNARRFLQRGNGIWGIVCLILLSSCGYRVASTVRLPNRPKSLIVHTFENRSTTFQIEQMLTQALIRKFVERSGIEIVSDEEKAAAVLEGRITRVTANPVTFVSSGIGSSFLVTMYASVLLKERESGKVLFERRDYVFREQYSINLDVESFFSEFNPALERIADDFAASVVAAITEDF